MKLQLLTFMLLLSTQLSADICLPTQREIREEPESESAHLQELIHAYMDLGLHERAQETLNRFHALIERLPRESAAPLLEKESNLRRQLGRQQYRFSELAESSFEHGPDPLSPEARRMAMLFAPQVNEWTQLQLRRDLVLLHGSVERASAFGIDAPARLLYAIQHTDEGSRCVLCAAEPLTWLMGAQFRLVGNEIHATLPDGHLLARYALWHKAPARFAPAPQVLPLRYLGADNDTIHVEITNLTGYPIELAGGSISATARLADGSVYICGTAYTAEPFLPLQPGEKKELHLKFHYSVEGDFNQLKEAQSVQLCYNAHKPRRSPYLSPLQIPYAGTPMMYRGGSSSWSIPIDDETFINVISRGYGYITDTYHIYRKEDGLWKHIGRFTCYPSPPPGSDTTQTAGGIYGYPVGIRREGNNLHLLNAQGNIFASIELSE